MLALHGMNVSSPIPSRWAATLPNIYGQLSLLCASTHGTPPPFSDDAFILSMVYHLSVFIERAGGAALIWEQPPAHKYQSFYPYFDKEEGVSYVTGDANVDRAGGVKVNIPVLAVLKSDLRKLLSIPHGADSAMKAIVVDILEDHSAVWEEVQQGGSPYRVTSWLVALLGVYSYLDLIRVTIVYCTGFGMKIPMEFSTMTLAINYIAYPMKVVVSLDPFTAVRLF